MQNESGLYPVGRAVLVRPYVVAQSLNTSAIIIPETIGQRETMAETRAVVVAVGNAAWVDEPGPRAKVGDHVMMTRYAGYMAIGPKDSAQYRLINDRDIFCRIDPPAGME